MRTRNMVGITPESECPDGYPNVRTGIRTGCAKALTKASVSLDLIKVSTDALTA